MMHNNKGISPLIATVLLIGFTIVLGAMIITWGTDFFRSTTEKVDKDRENALLCTSRLEFQIVDVKCAEGKVFVENSGSIDIVEMKLRSHKRADGTVTVQDINQSINVFGKIPIDVANLNELSKVDAIATVKTTDGTDIVCNNAIRERTINCP